MRRVLRELQEQLVVGLALADPVPAHLAARQRGRLGADAGALGRVPGVQVGAVRQPRRVAELHLGHHVVDVVPRLQVVEPDRAPVAAAVADLVGQPAAVLADVVAGERRRAVLGEGVRVEQQPPAGRELLEGVRDEPEVLLLRPVVAADHVAAADAVRGAGAGAPHDARHGGVEPRTRAQGVEVGAGEPVLLGHPGPGLGRVGVLQPPVRVGDLLPVQGLDGVVAAGPRVVHQAPWRQARPLDGGARVHHHRHAGRPSYDGRRPRRPRRAGTTRPGRRSATAWSANSPAASERRNTSTTSTANGTSASVA